MTTAICHATAEPAESERGRRLVTYGCSARAEGLEMTLFANGTVRLRSDDADGKRPVQLAELTTDEVRAFTARLLQSTDEQVAYDSRGGVSGETLQQCHLRLLPGTADEVSYRFSNLAVNSLDLSRRLAVVSEILELARSRVRGSTFPARYQPRIGDVLRRSDGSTYRIVAFTGDERGVEIVGLEQPLVLFVSVDQVAAEFDDLLSRDPQR